MGVDRTAVLSLRAGGSIYFTHCLWEKEGESGGESGWDECSCSAFTHPRARTPLVPVTTMRKSYWTDIAQPKVPWPMS